MTNFNLLSICGLGRSGSTLLDLMLGNASNAFSCGEIYARFRPWRPHHYEIHCSCGNENCPVWERLKDSTENSFYSDIANTQHVTHIIDSSKELSWLIDSSKNAINSGGKVAIILLWKQPEALAYSYWKRGLPYSKMRKDFMSYYGHFLQLNLPFISVLYEDLVTDTTNILMKICQSTGLDYFEGKESFWEKRHHHLFGSAGTRKQLHKKTGQIKLDSEFPEEYMDELEEIRNKIAEDTSLLTILSKIQKQDIKQNISCNMLEDSSQISKHILPVWYYFRRLRFCHRRFYPDRSMDSKKLTS